jgi:hypothetical protein
VGVQAVDNRFVIEPGTEPRTGGTAQVWQARDHNPDPGGPDMVAVKLYDGQALDDEMRRECFLREKEALGALSHPNIVRLVAAGYDAQRGKHYVAMEWLEHTALDHFSATPEKQRWPRLARELLEPLLDALAAAHARRILHRDLKPQNLMVSADGTVKLTDFGLAKLLDSLRFGVTLREFHSKPYAAPERGGDGLEERSDLFSLGVTVLRLLGVPEADLEHRQLDQAAAGCVASDDGRGFLRELVALQVEQRPRTASMARTELAKLLVWQKPAPAARPKVKVIVTPGAVKQAQGLLGDDESSAKKVITADLTGDDTAISRARNSPPGWGDETKVRLDLIGREFQYGAGFDLKGTGALVIRRIIELPPSLLERNRDAALLLPHQLVFGAAPPKLRDNADLLIELLSQHESERAAAEAERAEAALFDRWEEMLAAKTELERRREDPLGYAGFGHEEGMVTFSLAADVDETYLGQVRRVSLEGGGALQGTVIEVGERTLGLGVERGNPAALPLSGQLLTDRRASKKAIERQRDALRELRSGTAARADLRQLLVSPERAGSLRDFELGALFQELDEPKQRAVEVAMASPDFTLVQGPPGTGKTRFIAELIAQLLSGKPDARVLLSSQTHVALDNAAGRLSEMSDGNLRIVRFGPEEKVGREARKLTVPSQLESWQRETEKKARAYLTAWGECHGSTPEAVRAYALAGEIESAREAIGRLKGRLAELAREEERLLEILTDPETEPPSATSTGELPDLEDELAAVQDESEARRAELEQALSTETEPLAALKKLVGSSELNPEALWTTLNSRFQVNQEQLAKFRSFAALQDDWLRRFGRGEDFEQALLDSAQVVAGTCVGLAGVLDENAVFDLAVIDEASKANPTEALVPMVRSRRWVLVGDHHQLPPFADSALVDEGLLETHDLTRKDMRETVFGHLLERLPDNRLRRLTTQHRMLRPIGDLISRCFYEGELESARGDQSGFHSVREIFPTAVVWLTTSELSKRREEPVGTTFWNPLEVDLIRERLRKLDRAAAVYEDNLTVGVIAGYSEQARRLRRALNPDHPDWKQLRIDVHPIDSFQGQQRDVVIYSVTRSNSGGELGFLRAPERVNVALSRGRDALLIVGDAGFCARADDGNTPFADVLAHIRASRDCELKKARA